MIITVVSLHNEGATWMDKSETELITVQTLNLQEIAQTKSIFVQVSAFILFGSRSNLFLVLF